MPNIKTGHIDSGFKKKSLLWKPLNVHNFEPTDCYNYNFIVLELLYTCKCIFLYKD